MDIAGHVSKQMLKHYSHIRMEAKRGALEAIVRKQSSQHSLGETGGSLDGCSRETPRRFESRDRAQSRSATSVGSRSAFGAEDAEKNHSESLANTHAFAMGYPQKSPQSSLCEGGREVGRRRKSLKRIGSSGRTRTYNPSVNSRMLCH
jgi:hypothetical protein